MIDGIRATVLGNPVEAWEKHPILDFYFDVSEKTGLVSATKTAKLVGLNFEISYFKLPETCSINGSLHRFNNRKGINYDRFSFVEVQQVISDLKNHFSIEPKQTVLRSFEFGVNITTKYPCEPIIKAAICHKKQTAQPINKYNKGLGIQFVHGEFIIKLYDKAKQSGFKGQNILRFEIRARRMRFVSKYKIETLQDLTQRQKVEPLINELLKVASEIIFFDYKANASQLTPKELMQWNQYNNPNFWGTLNKSQTYKAKKRFNTLAQRIKAKDWNKQLIAWIKYEWFEIFRQQPGDLFTSKTFAAVEVNKQKGDLFTQLLQPFSQPNEAEKRRPFHNTFNEAEIIEKATFSHFICSVNTSPPGDGINIKQLMLFDSTQVQTLKRFCKTCGRDISHQKNGSLFCSEKYFGKEGKRCRNIESNKQRTIKNRKKKRPDVV